MLLQKQLVTLSEQPSETVRSVLERVLQEIQRVKASQEDVQRTLGLINNGLKANSLNLTTYADANSKFSKQLNAIFKQDGEPGTEVCSATLPHRTQPLDCLLCT